MNEYMNSPVPKRILVALLFFIGIVNAAALYWHLYFFIWWLDIPMHFLGGLWVALFTLATYYGARWPAQKDSTPLFVMVFALAATLVIGLGWELFEFNLSTIVGFSEHDLGDTLIDLVMDTLGAGAGAALFIRKGYNVKV